MDPANRMVVVEPGVLNEDLQQAVAAHGFFWPPDPTSAAACTIGGNLAYNSAGPRAVKYGTPRENTLGLTAVTGAARHPHRGVHHQGRGRLRPDAAHHRLGGDPGPDHPGDPEAHPAAGGHAHPARRLRRHPCRRGRGRLGASWPSPSPPAPWSSWTPPPSRRCAAIAGPDLPDGAGALLMIEVDGPAACIEAAAEAVARGGPQPRTGGTASGHAARPRRSPPCGRPARPCRRPCATSPPRRSTRTWWSRSRAWGSSSSGLERLSRQHGIRIVNFGHAGNGNIHVNLLV